MAVQYLVLVTMQEQVKEVLEEDKTLACDNVNSDSGVTWSLRGPMLTEKLLRPMMILHT